MKNDTSKRFGRFLLFASALILFNLGIGNIHAQVVFVVQEPSNLAGTYDFTYGDDAGGWGFDMDTMNVTGKLVIVSDGTAGDSLGCNVLTNDTDVTGNIAVVYRGTCQFGTKSLNAQNAGAIAVIIINNQAGAPIGMAPGNDGANVNIPVVMISKDVGALLRSYIDSGLVTAFIGNKKGAFANDIGFFIKDVVLSNSFSTPSTMAADSDIFYIPVSGFIYNYGINTQTNVNVFSTVALGPDTLYSASVSVGTLNPGDTVWFSLPEFSQAQYNTGLYTISYWANSDSLDDVMLDNKVSSDFWINDSLIYSKSRIVPDSVYPLANAFYKLSTGDPFKQCIVLDVKNANNQKISDISFSASASDSLTSKFVEVSVDRWDDVITPATITFDQLTNLALEYYTYTENLNYEFVKLPLSQKVPLQDNTRYLVCVSISDANMYLGYDSGINYETTLNTLVSTDYNDYSTLLPLVTLSDNTWYAAGFGTDIVPSIIVQIDTAAQTPGFDEILSEPTGLTVYPNPVVNHLNIVFTLSTPDKHFVELKNVIGQTVLSETIEKAGKFNRTVDLNGFSKGVYMLQIRNSSSSRMELIVVE
ncbi:MAG: T9SS type A sorting domain-containing protein [Bacteroidetes bacterium]|nr:T9SS type A sorting domain-containing protein [Bacteroidota bacterium]